VLVLVGAIAVSSLPQSAPRQRSVELEITLPHGGTPRVIVPEGEGATIKLPNGSRFGFVPTLPRDDDARVVVGIWDVDSVPFHKLGQVEVDVGGPVTHSDTSPSFGIRILRVVKSK
jgi:hypothetical protein